MSVSARSAASAFLMHHTVIIAADPTGCWCLAPDGKLARLSAHGEVEALSCAALESADEVLLAAPGVLLLTRISSSESRIMVGASLVEVPGLNEYSQRFIELEIPPDCVADSATTILFNGCMHVSVEAQKGHLTRCAGTMIGAVESADHHPDLWTTWPVVAMGKQWVLTLEDRGAGGLWFTIDRPSSCAAIVIDGTTWAASEDGGRVVVGGGGDGGSSLLIAGPDGTVPLVMSGPIGSVAWRGDDLLVAVFDGADEVVLEVGPDGTVKRCLDLPPGKKLLAPWIGAVAVADALRGVYVTPHSVPSGAARPTNSAAATERRTRILPDGPSIVTYSPPKPVGTIVHFHGGPESYDVGEPRLFGLPAAALALHWEWITVNYRGSLAPSDVWTRSAWKRWRASMREDWELTLEDAATTRIVTAGWSFGGSLALACAENHGVVGVIAGGVMIDLSSHVDIAMDVDPRHGPWFARRFALEGDDADFFQPRPLPPHLQAVLLHGVDDDHCPFRLVEAAIPRLAARGADVRLVTLPSGTHYGSSLDDAELIRAASEELLWRLGNDGVTLPDITWGGSLG